MIIFTSKAHYVIDSKWDISMITLMKIGLEVKYIVYESENTLDLI